MISIIIPTLNRAYTLSQVLDSFYQQKHVRELILVDDGGSDDTADVVADKSRQYPAINTIYLKNRKRMGAPFSRRRGLLAATQEFILFGDDDGFLEDNYAGVCLEKLKMIPAEIVSGRHFFRNPGESVPSAVARFGIGLQDGLPFDYRFFHIGLDARFQGDIELPITHAVFLARRELLLFHDFDTFYRRGNGFREESDVQAEIYCAGGKIVMTNDTHSVHMHPSEAPRGGQRTGHFSYFFWSTLYTAYFFSKYYNAIMKRQNRPERFLRGIALYSICNTMMHYPFWFRPVIAVRSWIRHANAKC
jgi:glycosyltransferase involved in cell wall biosynthesis